MNTFGQQFASDNYSGICPEILVCTVKSNAREETIKSFLPDAAASFEEAGKQG